MNKELVKEFVLEYKQEQEFQVRWNANHIKLENYFKYSGKVEKEKKEEDFQINKSKCKKIIADDSIVQFYFDNPGYTTKEIGMVFGTGDGVVRVRLNKYFKERENAKNNDQNR